MPLYPSTPDQLSELRARARTEPPSVLRLWKHDSRRNVRQIADHELRRRDREQAELSSLTGVVPPLEAA